MGCSVLLTAVLVAGGAVVLLGVLWQLRERVQRLERLAAGGELAERLRRLEQEVAALRSAERAAAPSTTPAAVRPTAVGPPRTIPPATVPAATVRPAASPPLAVSLPPAQRPPLPGPPQPVAPPPFAPPPFAPVVPARAPAEKPPQPATDRAQGFDWEQLVGVKLFSWIAGVALVVAAVFFLKYSVEHGWLAPPVRLVLGLLTGAGLLLGCELKAANRYPVTANALDAAGVAILFASLFAAHSLWGLISAGFTFVLLALVTVLAVLLSIRRDSLFIALLGLLGGFATPVLLSTGEDRPLTLFSYLALLDLGLGWVASRRRWRLLTALALALTTLYQWGWVVRFLSPERLPLGLGIFLLLPLAFLAGLVRNGGDEESAASSTGAGAWAAALPLALALFVAVVPVYGGRFWLLFGYLALLALGLSAIALWRGPALLHAVGAVATVVVTWSWLAISYRDAAAWPAVLVPLVGFPGFYLGASWLAARRERASFLAMARPAALVAPALVLAGALLVWLEPATVAPVPLFLALGGVTAAAAWVALRGGQPSLLLASGLALVVVEASWAARWLRPERSSEGLLLVGSLALLALAFPFLARRTASPWRYTTYLALAGPAILLATLEWPAFAREAGVLVLLGLLGLGFAATAVALGEGPLAALGLAACLLVLGGVAGRAGEAPWPLAALLLAVGLAGLGLLTFVEAAKRGALGVARGAFVAGAGLGIAVAQLAWMVAVAFPGAPAYPWALAAGLALVGLWLSLAASSGHHVLAAAATLPTAVTALAWRLAHAKAAFWDRSLLLALTLSLPFVLYPLLLGRRAGKARAPYLAAILGSTVLFFLGREALLAGGWDGVIGLLPLAQAGLLGLVLWRLLKGEPAGERDTGRLAMVAAAVLALVTVAVPMQLEKEWITLGWALLAAALAWLYRRLEHRGVLLWSLGLFVAVFARLGLNPAVLAYHPRLPLPIWNWYLYTYLLAAAACFAAVFWLRGRRDELIEGWRVTPILASGGTALLFLLVNIEIADCFSPGDTLRFGFLQGTSSLAEDLSYTIAWGLFALGLLAAGITLRQRAVRVCAIALLSITVLKAFLFDLSRLGGLYRVASFVGLAICLALVAVLLQKYVLRREGAEPRGPAPL